MANFSIFLSIICVIKNQSSNIENLLLNATKKVSALVEEYELILIDNASNDNTIGVLKTLVQSHEMPNLHVYALTRSVPLEIAKWIGLENSIGDFTAILDLEKDDISFLQQMLNKTKYNIDIICAKDTRPSFHSIGYKCSDSIFKTLYRFLNDDSKIEVIPPYLLMNKKVIHFILKHSEPKLFFQHITLSRGFSSTTLDYTPQYTQKKKNFHDSLALWVHLLVSTTHAPMRIVTLLCLFGAGINILYSVYVILIALFKTDIAPGWLSLSLQQSGMFFLISLVLLVIGEYLLHTASLAKQDPLYHISQEFSSMRITSCEKLNIEIPSHNKVMTFKSQISSLKANNDVS